jgi:hypothetical protein
MRTKANLNELQEEDSKKETISKTKFWLKDKSPLLKDFQ